MLAEAVLGFDPFDFVMAPDTPAKIERKRNLVAFYDGSGTIGQHPSVTYAGAITSPVQWAAFAEQWKATIEAAGIDYFKMSEAMGKHGQFAPKWTEWGAEQYDQRRDELIASLLALKSAFRIAPTGNGISTNDGSTLRIIGRVRDAKLDLFKGAIGALLTGVPPDSLIHIISDFDQEADDDCRRWVHQLAATDSPRMAKITGVSFFDDKLSQPLQFADMACWLARDELERRSKKDGRPVNPFYEQMFGASPARLELIVP